LVALHGEVGADAVTDHSRLASDPVGAGFVEFQVECALQAGRDVLDLAEHPVVLAVDVELGHLGAVVGHHE
jgi:hypothetical protein